MVFFERDNRSLDGTPLGQPSGRDAPSFSILQNNTVSSKNEIYSKLLNSYAHFLTILSNHKLTAKLYD